MYFLGIDPGAKGAMTIYKNGRAYIVPFDENDYIDTIKRLRRDMDLNKESALCYIEDVHAMPGNGNTSMFNFGKNFGWIIGVLDSNKIPIVKVSPMRWKKYFSLTNDKKESIDKAKSLYPKVNLRRTTKCRTDSDGMAESLLICEYGRNKYEDDKKNE